MHLIVLCQKIVISVYFFLACKPPLALAGSFIISEIKNSIAFYIAGLRLQSICCCRTVSNCHQNLPSSIITTLYNCASESIHQWRKRVGCNLSCAACIRMRKRKSLSQTRAVTLPSAKFYSTLIRQIWWRMHTGHNRLTPVPLPAISRGTPTSRHLLLKWHPL